MRKRTKTSIWAEAVAWVLAAAVLIGTILYFNVFKKQEQASVYGVGDACPQFDAALYRTKADPEGGVFTPKNAKGKVMILNFWYTTCGPCLKELPDFNAVQTEYGDKVKVVALHSYSADQEVDKQAFVTEQYPDYVISFAQDTESFHLYDSLGGKGSFPMTVITDGDGVIRFSKQGSISRAELKEEIDKLI